MPWVNVSTTATDQDSPITTGLVTAISNNITGLANGDSGAPRIQTPAYADNSLTWAKMEPPNVGNYILWQYWQFAAGTWENRGAWHLPPLVLTFAARTGNYRTQLNVSKTLGGGSGGLFQAMVSVNGARIGSACAVSGNAAGSQTLVQDIALNAGDLVTYEWYWDVSNPLADSVGDMAPQVVMRLCAHQPLPHYVHQGTI